MEDNETNSDDSEERKNFEKEIQKLKDIAESSDEITEDMRRLMDSDDPLERAFADHILRFERASKDPDTRTLRAILGNPSFPKEESLSDSEVEVELDRAHSILAEKNILLDNIHPIPSREIYRFITEELLENNEGYISVPGMTHHYIYEEFYPNHFEDIKTMAQEIIGAICDKAFNEFTCFLYKEIKFRNETNDPKEFVANMNDYLELFGPLALVDILVEDITIEEPHASADLSFTMVHHLEDEQIEIKSRAEFELFFDYGSYGLSSLSIPALGM